MVEYERMAVYPWHLAIAILFSYITLAFGLGLKSVVEVYNEYVAFAAFLILLLGFTLPFWLNSLFRKIVVDDKGITFKRRLNFKIPVLYEFDRFYAYDDLKWVKAKWIFVDIKGKAAFANPRWIIVRDRRGFIETIQKFAPKLVERR